MGAVGRRNWSCFGFICDDFDRMLLYLLPGLVVLFQFDKSLDAGKRHFFDLRHWRWLAIIGFGPKRLAEGDQVEVSGGSLVVKLIQNIFES